MIGNTNTNIEGQPHIWNSNILMFLSLPSNSGCAAIVLVNVSSLNSAKVNIIYMSKLAS